MMKKTATLFLALFSLSLVMLSVSVSANASTKYRSAPSITRGSWTPRWVITPTFSDKNVHVSKRTVGINGHNYKISYVKKTSKKHFTFYLKKHKTVNMAYKTRIIGNRKNVKSLSIRIDPTTAGYDGLFYKGDLESYPSKYTNFLTLDSNYNNGLPFDYIIITGKTLPNASVTFSGGGETVAHKNGTFTIRINRQGKSMIGNTVTVMSKLKPAKTVSKSLTVTTDPDGDDYDQSDYDSNGTLDYTPDYF